MSFTVAAVVGAGVGVAKLWGASKRKKDAKDAQKKAKKEMDAKQKHGKQNGGPYYKPERCSANSSKGRTV